MGRALTVVVLRTLLLLVLAASAALLYDYTGPLPAFCQAGEGCEAVRQSAYAYVAGIPQPLVGLLAHLVLFAITFLPYPKRRRFLFPIAAVGGLLGAGFLVVQAFFIGRFCWLCVTVDTAAIVIAVVAWLHRSYEKGTDGSLPRVAWASLAALSIVAPMIFATSRPDPPVPAAVARFWVPGKVNIVELSDFECPFCRILHPALKEAMEPFGDRVHFVRLSVPLHSHAHAKTAAKAYACARAQDKGEAMAHELFTAKDLSDDSCERLAKQVGVDEARFKKCFRGTEGQEAAERDAEKARQIGYKGLPTMWIGEKMIVGARNAEVLRAVIEDGGTAKSGPPQSALWGSLIAVFLLAGTFAVAWRPKVDPSNPA